MDATNFGRYQLLGLIGEGGMGKVFKAHDTAIDRDVAIKVLPTDLANEPGYRERFRREAHTAARLTEPHIIPIYDFGEVDGRLYLVMPIIDGIDVSTLLKRNGPMTPSRAVRLIEQVAAALDTAHAHGLVHRDVKPSNVLMTAREFAYLIDFGIARDVAATTLTGTGTVVGTPAYMAPERFSSGDVDARADVYALTCVLYECLTGDKPYPGDGMEQQIAGHLSLDPPRPSEHRSAVPHGFDEVIARGMAKKPDMRYQSAGDLAVAAHAALTTPQRDQAASTSHRSKAATRDAGRSPTAALDQPAEYKQVTVLLADVVRSMDIAAALDVERLREIMTELVERSAAVVQRYGGTVEYTGDGVMALFGAPVALEDHAFRGCLAALAIQEEANRLAAEVQRRDGVALRVRVSLNSGRVIAGEIGSGLLGYAATGEPVGFAQRMESVAPPGGVMLSESTARLVEHTVMLAEPAWVRVKGADEPVCVHRLVAISPRDGLVGRADASLVGRRWEMAALDAMTDEALGGRGGVVNVVGPPGIGKSRIAREAAALAAGRGVEVFWAFCESHARDIPFGVVTRLLRAGTGVADLDREAARARLRAGMPPDADPQDLLLLDDLLGIADPDVPLPQIDPDARRRRLTALINTASLAHTEPALFIIEDAHWIDAVSESMLADFLTVIPRTPSMVLITSRPEYEGALTRVHGAQTIALAPLGDSDTAALLGELLGSDRSVRELAAIIADRAAGNPFFAEEMVRELVQRGVLAGERGGYLCRADTADVAVPATVQAAIEARIDRLTTPAKRTLNAASVIGARFDEGLLAALGLDPVVDELLSAELIDQVRFTPGAEYAFHHPLIRAVAYESQLKSDRAEWHRRLAAAIEAGGPQSAEQNAALIAEHLEAAGDLRTAYGWHMRAATWATNRDIGAARLSWERARKIADALPAEDPDRAAMRIAPRTMLCAIAWRVRMSVAGDRFEELRQLCTAVGDKASLAIAMAGLVMDHAYQARLREASQLASEAMALVESLGDPALTVGLSILASFAKAESCEWSDVLRWSQRVIDLAHGDPSKGNFLLGSPLSVAFAQRALALCCLGRPGWRDDLRQGLSMGRSADPVSYAAVVSLVYPTVIPFGVLRADDSAMREIEDALQIAERSGDDFALAVTRLTLGLALLHRQPAAERDRGQRLLAEVSEVFLRRGHNLAELPIIEVYLARERNSRGDRDGAIPLMLAAVDQLFRDGRLLSWGLPATGVLVETLLERGAGDDVAEAEAAIERLATAPADDGLVIREIWLLRLRALLARAHGDAGAYTHFRDRYRDMATSLGFEGHMKWAEAMP